MSVRKNKAVLGEDDAGADHGAAVALAGKHRDGGGVDLLVNFLNAQLLAVALVVAELDLIGVGQTLDGRFAAVRGVGIAAAVVAAVFKVVVVIAAVAAERAAEPQRCDDTADDEQPEHAEKEDLESFSLLARRILFRLSGQRHGLDIALYDGLDGRFIAQHDLARIIALPVLGNILILVIHSVCFS